MGADKSLKMTRLKVEKVLPADYPQNKIMNEFDIAIEKAKAGKINRKELNVFLIQMPAKLVDDKLDSMEVKALMQQLNKIVEHKNKQ